jgi:hypothetical protein
MASQVDGSVETAAPDQAPAAASAPVEPEKRKRMGRRAARAEKKMQREQMQQQQRAEPKRRERSTVKSSAIISMLTESPPSREDAEREAAAEFNQALAPSMDLLRAAVPDASSPEEAWRTIESKLDQPLQDPDAKLPTHPVWQGDALVYQQLRRHYGRTSPAGSFRQGWSPGSGLPPMLGG